MATDAQLTLAIIARDKATADLKKVESQLARLQKRHTSFAGTAAKAFAVGAVVAFGAASVKAFADAEKSQARLQLAYQKFPALAGVSIASLRELNLEMQAKVGVDDDALASAQAVLAQFRLTGEQIKELTPLLVDYATVTGQDVTAAAGALGKAFMGNAKALKAIGINFKATGDTAKDFDTVMAALEQKVGGAGEAFGKTTAGQLAILDAQFGDLQETVGEALVPALQGLVSVATPVVKVAGAIPAPVRSAGLAAAAAGAGFLLLSTRIESARANLQDFATTAPRAASAAKALGGVAAVTTVVYGLGEAAAWASDQLGIGAKSADEWATTLQGNLGGEDLLRVKEALTGINGQGGIGAVFSAAVRGDAIGAVSAMRTASNEAERFDSALAGLVRAGGAQKAAAIIQSLGLSAEDVAAKLPQYAAASSEAATGTTDLAESAGDAAVRTSHLGSSAAALKAEVTGVTAALKGWEAIDDRGAAADALAASLDSLSASVKANKGTLTGNTEAARTARAAFRESAESVKAYAETFKDPERKAAVLRDGLDKLKGRLKGMGLSAGEIAEITRPYDAAAAAAQRVINKQAGIQRKIVVDIVTNYGPGSSTYNSQVPKKARAQGGAVFGPGSATSDSIPAMLSNGEYVINAQSAKRIGYGNLDRLNRYADGGKVSKKRSAAREALKDLLQQRRDAVGTITSSLLGAVGLGAAFDPGKYRDLLDALKTAGDAVVAAQEKVNEAKAARVNASGPTEMAAALKAEAQASRELAEAKKAESVARTQAENAKPTAKNVRKGLRSLAERMSKFASVLKALKRKGLRDDLLAQLVDMGPMEGLDEARALNAGSAKDIAGINADQASIVKRARAIGRFGAHAQYDPLIRAQRNVINGGSAEPVFVSKTVVQVDGKVLVEAAQRYKRANGNKPVGLG